MEKTVDVVIVGAGSAGLSALKEVRKKTDNYLVIEQGPQGTTCARVGCMPSKVLIQVANSYHARLKFLPLGILGGEEVAIDWPKVLEHVRELRDRFVGGVIASSKIPAARLMRGQATFTGPATLKVGKTTIKAKRIILATGSTPIKPDEFKALGDACLTTDSLFELKTFPKKIAVVGLGVIGLEIGQALSRLGVDVYGFDRSEGLADLTDPELLAVAREHFSKEFPLYLGAGVKVTKEKGGVRVQSGNRSFLVDAVLASLGRRANLTGIGIEHTGAKLDETGFPEVDQSTMQLGKLPIFIAGDAARARPLLHEAADGGRIAGLNSLRKKATPFLRRTSLAITFTEPNIATVGKRYSELKGKAFSVGKVDFTDQGRARILGENHGALHVYADKKTGRLLGAEMLAPRGEHLAHFLALAIESRKTAADLLRTPFYHPVVEEGLRTALRSAVVQLGKKERASELATCEEAALDKLS